MKGIVVSVNSQLVKFNKSRLKLRLVKSVLAMKYVRFLGVWCIVADPRIWVLWDLVNTNARKGKLSLKITLLKKSLGLS